MVLSEDVSDEVEVDAGAEAPAAPEAAPETEPAPTGEDEGGEPKEVEKPADEPEYEPVSAESLEVPDDSPLLQEPDYVESLQGVLDSIKATPEQAQAILARDVAREEGRRAAAHEEAKAWGESVKESWGDEFDARQDAVRRLFADHAPEGFSKMLVDTGMGNYPGLNEMLWSIAKKFTVESKDVPNGGTTDTPEDNWESTFPNSGPSPDKLLSS